MKEYTSKEIKALKSNPYTFKVTKSKLYFTAEFKERFWAGYQAGNAPRKLLQDFGYDLEMFGQKQIDSITQRVKKEALAGKGFTEGEQRGRRPGVDRFETEESPCGNNVPAGSLERMRNELNYLRQEVEFIKKILKGSSTKKGKSS